MTTGCDQWLTYFLFALAFSVGAFVFWTIEKIRDE